MRLLLVVVGTLAVVGCASLNYEATCSIHNYKDRWLSVNSAETNAPSGYHLLKAKQVSSGTVSNFVRLHGLPAHVRQPRNPVLAFEMVYAHPTTELVRVFKFQNEIERLPVSDIDADYLPRMNARSPESLSPSSL